MCPCKGQPLTSVRKGMAFQQRGSIELFLTEITWMHSALFSLRCHLLNECFSGFCNYLQVLGTPRLLLLLLLLNVITLMEL